MTGLRVLVVDDEPLARRRIIRLLQGYDRVGAVFEAGDVDQALEKLAEHFPDIVLLDIQMPGGGGFELLARLDENPPVVVFVTAFDHFALRAFEASAIDYITKPIEPGRFAQAMERAFAAVNRNSQAERVNELQEALETLKRELRAQTRDSIEFWVKSNSEFLRIAAEDVICFQADRDYVRLHVAGAEYLYQESLARLEQRLDPAEFIRIHRGAIIRRDAIARIKPAPFAALLVVLSNGLEVRVGRTYTAAIRAEFLR